MDNEIAAAEVLKSSESSSPALQTLDVEFVATIPPSIIFSPHIKNVNQIYPSIKRLIAGAKTELWIINPFFDEYGICSILPALLGAAEFGVDIRIITREIFNPQKNARIAKALAILISSFIEKNMQNKLAIRDFFKFDRCEKKQIYAVHSKFLIADNNVAYIGSANLTETSLKSNFEIGVILRGEGIKPLIEIAEAIWDKSAYVDLQQFLCILE
jgi:phosphatidylserine/phosphatidylglycerophosphate/cardiolipin synthase-like enzyme